MNLAELVRALAEYLETILPAGITIRTDDRHLIVQTPQAVDWLIVADNIEHNVAEGASFDQAIENTVHSTLQELQDIVTVSLTVPWPQERGMGRSEFAPVEAQVIDGVLQIWVGERNTPLFPVGRIAIKCGRLDAIL